ncbi:TPA: DUF262 domain-containing protein [Serratia marcescens]|nr:DUF262 domain-containing protein [Serratia marcescens]
MILEAEIKMWEKEKKQRSTATTDAEIEAKYDTKSERIVTETNREKLPNFYEALKKPDYMNTRPFYQRRSRWTPKLQSRLIESILINIPIPPLFVYEIRSNVHEVMDGQQRISAIKAFYSNELVLEGLERWPELNGRTYSKLPKAIQDGIDRRSITWISVLRESTENEEEAMLLKQLVFERLNTGGVELSHQEIRNALFSGEFNDALLELSRLPEHRDAWGLPHFSASEIQGSPAYLDDSSFYKKMEDVEVILRFFALRNSENYQKGMRGFLDLYMLKSKIFSSHDIDELKSIYTKTISTALKIYDDYLFRVYDPEKEKWLDSKQKAFADAVLVGISRNIEKSDFLIANREKVIEATRNMFSQVEEGSLTGRGNTKRDVIKRIDTVTALLDSIG